MEVQLDSFVQVPARCCHWDRTDIDSDYHCVTILHQPAAQSAYAITDVKNSACGLDSAARQTPRLTIAPSGVIGVTLSVKVLG
jgi:hypothetical protein